VRASRLALLGAYAAVYILWGSTYLALRYLIEALPPLAAAGTRFLIAGSLLAIYAVVRGLPMPTRRQWGFAAVIGGFLLLGGNGGVVLSELRIPSAIAALLVAVEPLWIVLLAWAWPGGTRPTRRMVAGFAIGFTGVAVLVDPWASGVGHIDLLGALAVTGGALSWAIGSLLSAKLSAKDQPSSPIVGSAAQMLTGGAMLFVVGTLDGELGSLSAAAFTPKAMLSLAYLVVCGSIVAFNSYSWLLRVEPPARVATYAFVNPAVAMLLGWLIGGEPLTGRTLIAAAAIIVAVALIVTGEAKPAKVQAASAPIPDEFAA